jgi:hypothetical protein
MPEAKTQSKDSNDFSCPAQKVDEIGRLEKVSEGDMGEEERKSGDEMPRHSTMNDRVQKAEGWTRKVVLTQIVLTKM